LLKFDGLLTTKEGKALSVEVLFILHIKIAGMKNSGHWAGRPLEWACAGPGCDQKFANSVIQAYHLHVKYFVSTILSLSLSSRVSFERNIHLKNVSFGYPSEITGYLRIGESYLFFDLLNFF
jgi:hypothetical protein